MGAGTGGILAAPPLKAATTHASPMAAASAIRTSRRFSRLMGGFMMDISIADVTDDQKACSGEFLSRLAHAANFAAGPTRWPALRSEIQAHTVSIARARASLF